MRRTIYQDIYDQLRDQILAGTLKPGEALLPERELCRVHEASNTTIRRALELLQRNKLIEKRHGSGNYVRAQNHRDTVGLVLPRYFQQPATYAFAESFNSTHPNLKLELIPAAANILSTDALRTLLMTHGKPLLVLINRATEAFAKANLLHPMDRLPGSDDIFRQVPDASYAAFADTLGIERHMRVSFFLCPTALAVNLDLAARAGLPLDSLPETWDELLSWCHLFNEWREQNDRSVHATFLFREHLLTQNLSYYFMGLERHGDVRHGIDLDTGSIAPCQGFLNTFHMKGYAHQCRRTPPDPFVNGKYLFHLSARSWVPAEIERYNPGMNYCLIPLPTRYKGSEPISVFGESGMVIARLEEDRAGVEGCWNALKAMFEHSDLADYAFRIGLLPANLKAFQKLVAARPMLQTFYDLLPFYQNEPDDSGAWRKLSACDQSFAEALAPNHALSQARVIEEEAG